MTQFKQYRKTQIAEMRPYELGESMKGIVVNDVDRLNGSPRTGDMISRNLDNHDDQWLVSEKFFKDNYILA
jgi:hypothetical protein